MKIDAHQHFWNYDMKRHAWISESMAVIRRDFLPSDLKPILRLNGIDGCVAVQVDQTMDETEYLLQHAHGNDFIKGIVGWVDLRDTNVGDDLEKYKQHFIIKGFRHIVQGELDPNFLLRPEFLRGISYLESYGFTYDILVFPHQLGAVLEFVKHFPNQRFVLDHLAKPYIKDGFFEGWALLMKAIARHENVFCKLSGMVTEADYTTWTQDQLHPYMNVVLEAFGTDRILFGSDWPVCLVAGSYEQVLHVVSEFINTLSQEEQTAIMGQNAIQFYKL